MGTNASIFLAARSSDGRFLLQNRAGSWRAPCELLQENESPDGAALRLLQSLGVSESRLLSTADQESFADPFARPLPLPYHLAVPAGQESGAFQICFLAKIERCTPSATLHSLGDISLPPRDRALLHLAQTILDGQSVYPVNFSASDPAERHFTATGLPFDGERVLLIHHAKLGVWLPPGGHLENNENPDSACRREVQEETAVQTQIVSSAPMHCEIPNETALPLPLCFYLEDIRAQGNHFHMDFVYRCTLPSGETAQRDLRETTDMGYFFPDGLPTPIYDNTRACLLALCT